MYIKQKTDGICTIIDTSTYVGALKNHPSVLTYPDLFEVVTEYIPEQYQILKFDIPGEDPVVEVQTLDQTGWLNWLKSMGPMG